MTEETQPELRLGLSRIAIAVRFACQVIGQEWRDRQGARYV